MSGIKVSIYYYGPGLASSRVCDAIVDMTGIMSVEGLLGREDGSNEDHRRLCFEGDKGNFGRMEAIVGLVD